MIVARQLFLTIPTGHENPDGCEVLEKGQRAPHPLSIPAFNPMHPENCHLNDDNRPPS